MKRDLAGLAAREHDLLVIGGGIYGLAAAWDAAQRGLQVALVERLDFASGVSWNSLKTVHGGLRYLQTADLPRLRESVRERRALLRIAPALVKPLGFLAPTYGHGPKGREALAAGLVLNDLLSAGRNDGLRADRSIPKCRLLSRDEVLAWFPNLPAAGLNGGALWHDAQVESTERLVLGFAHAAASAGAVLANHVSADSLRREGGRVAGVRATDRLTGDTFDVRARMTLNAAGPEAFRLLEAERIAAPRLALVDGMNLVLTRPTGMPVGLAGRADGRFLFLVPWRDRAIAGTAYAPADRSPAGDLACAFLDDLGRAFPWAGLTRADVAVVHRGRLPAEAGTFGLRSRALVLDHHERDGTPGLVSVLGVKLTTARGVAETAVDLVARRLGRPVAPCRTAVTELPEARGLEGPLAERAKIAVRGEMAVTLADAVLRRLDLGTAGRPGPEDLDVVEATLAAELGWDDARRRAEREAVARVYPEPLQ